MASNLLHHITRVYRGEPKLVLILDNTSSTNKNLVILSMCAMSVYSIGMFERVELWFPPAGHAKGDADRLFGNISMLDC